MSLKRCDRHFWDAQIYVRSIEHVSDSDLEFRSLYRAFPPEIPKAHDADSVLVLQNENRALRGQLPSTRETISTHEVRRSVKVSVVQLSQ